MKQYRGYAVESAKVPAGSVPLFVIGGYSALVESRDYRAGDPLVDGFTGERWQADAAARSAAKRAAAARRDAVPFPDGITDAAASMPGVPDSVRLAVRACDPSDAAIEYGRRCAANMFDGRAGHGGARRVVERHLNKGQVVAALAIAYQAGVNASAPSGGAASDSARLAVRAMASLLDVVPGFDSRMVPLLDEPCGNIGELVRAALRDLGGAA